MSNVKVLRNVRNPKTDVQVPLIDVFALKTILKKAQKTKPIWGKPAFPTFIELENDLELKTIEGNEAMREGSWIVKGEISEKWFMDSKTLFKSYNGEFTDAKGWTKFNPKPESWRWVTLVQFPNGFASHAQWGSIKDGTFQNGEDRYIQFSKGQAGYVVNNPDNTNDWWIVVPKLFVATYIWL